jgi:hypothetical protein
MLSRSLVAFLLTAGLLLHARALAAQSVSISPPGGRRFSFALPAPDAVRARFADALGVGYDPARPQTPSNMATTARDFTRRLARASTTTIVAPMHDVRSCPMPIATVDSSRFAPMPRSGLDSAAVQRAASTGRLIGCANPLAP